MNKKVVMKRSSRRKDIIAYSQMRCYRIVKGMANYGLTFPWAWDKRQNRLYQKDTFQYELPFEASEYENRINNIRREMAREGLDCLFVLGDIRERGNVRYVSNFYPMLRSTVLVIPKEGDLTLVTDASVHGEPLHSYLPLTWIKDVRGALTAHGGFSAFPGRPTLLGHIKDVISEKKLTESSIGFVNENLLGYNFFNELQKSYPRIKWKGVTEMYLRVKAIKSENEMKIIRRLSEIGDLALNAAVEAMVPGVTELEVAGEAEYALRTGGMETIAYLFDTRVASGPRSGLKNALPSARKLQKGDMVYVDLSATYHGYALDCSRSTCVGKPNPEQEKMLETAVLMYDAVRGAAKPGVHPKELIKIARQTAKENGEEENFVEFVVAHGIGTCQVEIPRVNPISQDVLAPNMTFALEAMLVKTDFGTGCCEDIIAVTQNGSERLAKYETRCWPAGQSYL